MGRGDAGIWRRLVGVAGPEAAKQREEPVRSERARPTAAQFVRKRFGPAFTQIDGETVRIDEGAFAGAEFKFGFKTDGSETTVTLFKDASEVGRCDIQRDPKAASVVVWNIMLGESWRNHGLAPLLISAGLRRMLAAREVTSLALRMVRLINPRKGGTRFQNFGIGLIARQLGFEPKHDLREVLRVNNIESVELVRAVNGIPPGYLFMLRSAPGTLAAFLIDPATEKPFPQGHRVYGSLITVDNLERWIGERALVVGDADYVLREGGVPELINHLASSESEAAEFARWIRAGN